MAGKPMLPRRFDIKAALMKAVLIASTCLAIAVCPCVFGQPGPASTDAPPKLPAFAVTSVKPNPKATGWRLSPDPEGWSGTGVTLFTLIQEAYLLVEPGRIEGIPQWADSDRFDIEVKLDEADAASFQKLPYDQRLPLLQALLADRFRLTAHFEPRIMPIFLLTLAKGGLKMKETTSDELSPRMSKEFAHVSRARSGEFEAVNMTVAQLTSHLTFWSGRNVVDKTGLTGRYDIKLAWSPDSDLGSGHSASNDGQSPLIPPAPAGPSIFTAVQEQLGLKLEPEKGTVQVLVVDHVEEPAPN
jgi:uncharacterized protein (TIGR03435 family)